MKKILRGKIGVITSFITIVYLIGISNAQTDYCINSSYKGRAYEFDLSSGLNKTLTIPKYCPFGCDPINGDCALDPFAITIILIAIIFLFVAFLFWFIRKR